MKLRINFRTGKIHVETDISLAKSWNDLSEKQLQEAALLMEWFRSFSKKKPPHKEYQRLYVNLIKTLLRHNGWLNRRIALRQIPPKEYLQHIRFLLNGNTRTVFPKSFYGLRPPGDRLQNLTMEEFSFADSLYYNYRETGDERYLNLLCATLYRPEGGNENDRRKPFIRSLVEKHDRASRLASRKKKLAIAYAYEGSRNYIVNQYPKVFPKKTDDAEPHKQKYVPFGQLIHYKIQFDPTKIKKTEKLNIHKFFSIYENELREMEKQKQFAK